MPAKIMNHELWYAVFTMFVVKLPPSVSPSDFALLIFKEIVQSMQSYFAFSSKNTCTYKREQFICIIIS